MSHVQNLPSANAKFSAKSGLGSFQNKLTHGMHAAGELSAFQRHPEAVKSLISHVEKYQTHIRRGGLSENQIKKIKSEVVKSDPTLTGTAKKLINKTLIHLSAQAKVTPPRPELPGVAPVKPGHFAYKPARNSANPHITSIAQKQAKASTFHQFGDTVSHTKNGERATQIYGSIGAAIKNKLSDTDKEKKDDNITTITQAPLEDIKD